MKDNIQLALAMLENAGVKTNFLKYPLTFCHYVLLDLRLDIWPTKI